MFDRIGIPQRLEQHVAKTQCHQVLDRFLAQIMIDPESSAFGEHRVHGIVDRAARFKIVAQGLFKADADIIPSQPGSVQPLDRGFKQEWRG